jgi:hypothetical protein
MREQGEPSRPDSGEIGRLPEERIPDERPEEPDQLPPHTQPALQIPDIVTSILILQLSSI